MKQTEPCKHACRVAEICRALPRDCRPVLFNVAAQPDSDYGLSPHHQVLGWGLRLGPIRAMAPASGKVHGNV